MALALDLGFHRGAVHPCGTRPVAKALTRWDFAIEVQRRALACGRPVVVWVEVGVVKWAAPDKSAANGGREYARGLEHEGLIGVYDGDVLVRDLAKDLEGYL